ncbi:beta strand repeat-containing protein, partial [Simplicispira hankyongi]
MTYSPNAPGFDGIVKVLDAGNTVQATINITATHLSDPVNNYLQDMRVAPLLNGGFVVVWTEVDKATSSTPANFYALFDNAGTLTKSTSALASVSGYAPQVVGLTGGGFATAVLNGSKVYVNAYSYVAGNYVHNTETTVGDSTNPAPNPGSDPDIGKLWFLGGLNLAALSDGSFVITGAVYDWVSSTYTPLGDFVFKLASDGTAANFASGVNYARVNWSQGQTNDTTLVTSFNGGFATLNQQASIDWEVTVFNNDGSLVTTDIQNVTVGGSGGGARTYTAARIFPASATIAATRYWGNPSGVGNASASFGMNGSNLVAMMLNDAGGFSTGTISPATGALIGSVVDSGITVPAVANTTTPPNPALVTPFYLPDGGGGYSLLYSASGTDSSGYIHSDLYQVGLTAIPLPDAPTGLSATPGNAQATISFTAGSDNGSPITNYQYSLDAGAHWTSFTPAATSSPVSITGLTNGTAYSVTLRAVNAGGGGAASAAVGVTPYTVPGAPTIGTATAGSGQASVAFTAPASNGGSAITGYTVTSNPGGLTGTGAASPITVTGLTSGTAYTFTVTATNAAGTGSASAASNSVTPKGAQTITFANPGAQNFGTTPTLTATATSGLAVAFTSATTGVCTVTSGGALTFVTAGNCTIHADQAGDGTYLAAPQVSQTFAVNAVVPGAPTIGTATAGSGQASVAFTAPASNGGSAITGYTVTSNPGGLTGTGATSPITVTGLTNGTAYTFTVTATNTAGTGSASAA